MKRRRGRPRKKRGPGRTTPDLSLTERYQIKALLDAGHTPGEISLFIKRSRGCVYKEIKRGLTEQISGKSGELVLRYEPDAAQRSHAVAQTRKGAPLKIGHDHETAAALDRYVIEERYSPYAAIEKARSTGELKTAICKQTYYNYIKKRVTRADERHLLYGFRKTKKTDKEDFGVRRNSSRLKGKSIEQRPSSILSRKEFGHWEGDLIIGRSGSKAAVLTLVERKTRQIIALKINDKSAVSVVCALDRLERRIGPLFEKMFRTVTFDNGTEFARHEDIKRSAIDLLDPGGRARIGEVYYAHPYCSSERGSNENANRMVRRAFPKGTDFELVDQIDLARHVDWVNSYPRKILGGRCSRDLFVKEIEALAA